MISRPVFILIFIVAFFLQMHVDASGIVGTPTDSNQIAGSNLSVYEIEGTAQGKDLFIINAFMVKGNKYCITKVIINDKVLMQDPRQDKIGLGVSKFPAGQYLNIKIVHLKECKPKIINPEVIKSKSTFELVSFKADAGTLKWTTKNETNQEPYYIEHLRYNKWVVVGKVTGKGTDGFNNYQIAVQHHSGSNKYRIKQADITNQYIYKEALEYLNNKPPVSFYPARVDKSINFSAKAEYEIFNDSGLLVKKGKDVIVDVSALPAGVYYLNLDNRTEKFLKK